ncbi:MAG: hypothetical protein WCK63_15585 [Betaproteobacteria bacterium]
MKTTQTLPSFTIDVQEVCYEEGVVEVVADYAEDAEEIIDELFETDEIFSSDFDDVRVKPLLPADVHRSNIFHYGNADKPQNSTKSFFESGLPFEDFAEYPTLHYPAPSNGVAVWFARCSRDYSTYAVRAANFSAAVNVLLGRDRDSKDDEFVTTIMASDDGYDMQDFIEVLASKKTVVDASGFEHRFSEGEPA